MDDSERKAFLIGFLIMTIITLYCILFIRREPTTMANNPNMFIEVLDNREVKIYSNISGVKFNQGKVHFKSNNDDVIVLSGTVIVHH